MDSSQQYRGRRGESPRSQARRAELIVVGRTLFAHTSYDALSMDDIARQAGVAKGLIYYYFGNKRGYYLAIIEESVAELVDGAADDPELPPGERVERTLDGYLHYAQHHQAAYRTIVTGGVGHDSQVLAIRDRVRERLLTTLGEEVWEGAELPPLARSALVGWLSSVEGVTLDWLARGELERAEVCALLVSTLRRTLEVVAEFGAGPAPVPSGAPAPPRPRPVHTAGFAES
ncbi:TetR/AcrR family transcriptional regulator [Streptomyces sp. AJS327]|uniref:TetR/AcrR family transcriptional regulator n=1 Tax=Streptomyces sp. AJS327 TaxID=2545265 RepID=UPI0015DD7560|nr:TetR/AcrR family transcriptional regulator [Streptomyces sp. AJS327]MBA0051004.1 TetR/AcrR family transcriptional regulator [Streptomyces sp. AJS327]